MTVHRCHPPVKFTFIVGEAESLTGLRSRASDLSSAGQSSVLGRPSARTAQPHRRCILRCTGFKGPGGLSIWTRLLPSTEAAVVQANRTEEDNGVRGEPGAHSAERQDSDAWNALHQHEHTENRGDTAPRRTAAGAGEGSGQCGAG